jgi:hypothetical protein
MSLYYAIISFCLTICPTTDSMERYIYEEPIEYGLCIHKVVEMIKDVREHNPDIRHRPIATLCVSEELLKNIEKYTIWHKGKSI